MRWILGAAAAALLFATQAGAATINGPDEVVQGQVYTLTFDTGAVTVEGKPNYFEMDLLLPTKKITFSGALFPSNNQFKFDWQFSTVDQTNLYITAELRSFYGVSWVPTGTYGSDLYPRNPYASEYVTNAFSASREFNLVSEQTVAVMPIGGTLPLMLSALGLMGWAAKRRGKRGALSA